MRRFLAGQVLSAFRLIAGEQVARRFWFKIDGVGRGLLCWIPVRVPGTSAVDAQEFEHLLVRAVMGWGGGGGWGGGRGREGLDLRGSGMSILAGEGCPNALVPAPLNVDQEARMSLASYQGGVITKVAVGVEKCGGIKPVRCTSCWCLIGVGSTTSPLAMGLRGVR